jgi:hypothetical protein
MAAASVLEIQVHAIKWAIATRTLMKIGTQTKTDMLSSNVIKAEAYVKKRQKLNVKNDIVLKR